MLLKKAEIKRRIKQLDKPKKYYITGKSKRELLMILDELIKRQGVQGGNDINNEDGAGDYNNARDTYFNRAFKTVANKWRSAQNDNRVRPLKLGELHYKAHNWTGPGTIIDNETAGAPPINGIDDCSRTHDFDYMHIEREPDPQKRAKLVQLADKAALACYANYPDQDGYFAATTGIGGKFLAEQLLSFYQGKPSVFYGGFATDEDRNLLKKIKNVNNIHHAYKILERVIP